MTASNNNEPASKKVAGSKSVTKAEASLRRVVLTPSIDDLYVESILDEELMLTQQPGLIIERGSGWKRNGYLAVKRTFDFLVGLFGSIATLPVVGIVKIAYMLHGDFAPVFYSQTRVGQDGKRFEIRKIRSMVPDADKILAELLEDPKYRAEWDKYQKLENDPRITPLGGIIRKTSLDELPQFFNILNGSMSLIGPRPLVVGELDMHGGNHRIYESVKPGLTGWWAANGRSDVSYRERLEQEYYYVENQSIKMDLKCIVRTVKTVLKKEGAK